MRRRRVLGGVAAAGSTALAGCSNLPFGGNEFEPRAWLYDPSERSDGPWGEFRARLKRPARVHERSSSLPDEYVERFEGGAGWATAAGTRIAEIETFLTFKGAFVAHGGFDGGEARSELADSEMEHVRDHGGYAIYQSEDPPADSYGWGLAVGDEALVGRPQYDPEETADKLEFVVDTRNGAVDRLAEEVDTAELLLSGLPDGQEQWVHVAESPDVYDSAPRDGEFEGMTGRGTRFETEGEETLLDVLFVFDDADPAASAPLDEWVTSVEGDRWYGAAVDDVATSRDGAVVHAEATVPSDKLWSE